MNLYHTSVRNTVVTALQAVDGMIWEDGDKAFAQRDYHSSTDKEAPAVHISEMSQ